MWDLLGTRQEITMCSCRILFVSALACLAAGGMGRADDPALVEFELVEPVTYTPDGKVVQQQGATIRTLEVVPRKGGGQTLRARTVLRHPMDTCITGGVYELTTPLDLPKGKYIVRLWLWHGFRHRGPDSEVVYRDKLSKWLLDAEVK
jgi:hypothetical protein